MKKIFTILILLIAKNGLSQVTYSSSDDFNIVNEFYEIKFSAIRFEQQQHYRVKHQDSLISTINGYKAYGIKAKESNSTILNIGHVLIKDSVNYSPYPYSLDVGGMVNPWGDFYPKLSIKFIDDYLVIKGMFGDELKPYYVIWIITKEKSERVLITDNHSEFYNFTKK